MRLLTRIVATVGTVFALLPGWAGPSSAQHSPITAIDVLLEPDATMLKHAAATNARLLKLSERTVEGLRALSICLFVFALAAFPSGRRREHRWHGNTRRCKTARQR